MVKSEEWKKSVDEGKQKVEVELREETREDEGDGGIRNHMVKIMGERRKKMRGKGVEERETGRRKELSGIW